MKLKMIFCVLLAVLLVPAVCLAEAELQADVNQIGEVLFRGAALSYEKYSDTVFYLPMHKLQPIDEVLLAGAAPSYEKYADSVFHLPVTYKTMCDGEVVNEVTYYEKVADIHYKYYIVIDSDGKCVGGHIVRTKGWPEITTVDAPHLGLVIDVREGPTGSVVPINNGDEYQVTFEGGCVEITYNRVIYKDLNNQQTGQDSITETRVFYYTKTGPAEP